MHSIVISFTITFSKPLKLLHVSDLTGRSAAGCKLIGFVLKLLGRETDHYAHIMSNLRMQGSVPSLVCTLSCLDAQLNTVEFTFTFTNSYSTNKCTFLLVRISLQIRCYIKFLNFPTNAHKLY